MSNSLRSLGFALGLCIVCSLLLTFAATGLAPLQQANERIDRQRNILKSVGLLKSDQRYRPAQIEKLYADNIQPAWLDGDGRLLSFDEATQPALPLYLHLRDKQMQAYVVPVDSRGLWGRIHGYLAIRKDGATIAGFTVFKHAETPGLGGEIEKPWFQQNFIDKKIVDDKNDFASVTIAKGKAADSIPEPALIHHVDGISGATLTGKYLSAGLKTILQQYEPMAMRLRSGQPIGE